jgi:hypothetical protein
MVSSKVHSRREQNLLRRTHKSRSSLSRHSTYQRKQESKRSAIISQAKRLLALFPTADLKTMKQDSLAVTNKDYGEKTGALTSQ